MTSSVEPQRPRRFAKTRRVLRYAFFAFVLWAAWGSYQLTRDPEPGILARVGEVETIVSQSTLPAEGEEEAATIERMRVYSTSGLEIELALRLPEVATPENPRPLVLLLGGHRTGRDAVDLVRNTRGVAVAAVSFPYDGPHKLKGLAIVPQIPAIQDGLFDAPAALMLARKAVVERPEIDGDRIDLVGVSLGTPFVTIAGALDANFRRVWSIHGSARLGEAMEFDLRRKIGFGPARHAVASLAFLLAGGHALDPEDFVERIAPREFVMINAENDEKLPRAGVEALYEAAREPKELTWRPGEHIRPKKEDVVRDLVSTVVERIESDAR